MRTKRNIKITAIFPKIKELKYFNDFFLIPTIATFTSNTYGITSYNYLYTRYITLYWLWFDISIQWEYKKLNKLNNYGKI